LWDCNTLHPTVRHALVHLLGIDNLLVSTSVVIIAVALARTESTPASARCHLDLKGVVRQQHVFNLNVPIILSVAAFRHFHQAGSEANVPVVFAVTASTASRTVRVDAGATTRVATTTRPFMPSTTATTKPTFSRGRGPAQVSIATNKLLLQRFSDPGRPMR
jgi:hypothetical protein